MNVIYFNELESTNDYAKQHLEDLHNFDVIVAHRQTNGHGQWNRKWIDIGQENIYMTIVLKPEKLFSYYTSIVRFSVECVCKVMKSYGVNPRIKEPNDIIVNGKKICGILAESITIGENLKGIVIGIGINLNTSVDKLCLIDQKATSLNIETGKKIDKIKFLEKVLQTFEEKYSDFCLGKNLN